LVNLLGISGLANSPVFKRETMPGLSPRQYRLAQGADSAAALIVDGEIAAAAAQERFSRVKGTYEFPADAITYCLQAAGLTISDIDYVAHNFNYEPYEDFFRRDPYLARQFDRVYSRTVLLQLLAEAYPAVEWSSRLIQVPHHLAHAASAYYASGFQDAAVLVADGIGEFHSTTTMTGSAEGLDVIRQVPGLNSIGMLYGLVTLYLGFFMNFDEYKVMGLAPYGDSTKYLEPMRRLVCLEPNGMYRTPILFANRTVEERETYAGTLAELERTFGPAREPEAPIEERHQDIAAALQQVTEEALLHVLRQLKADTDLPALCMAGGVALNCTANATVRASGLFDAMFVQPAAGDDGTSLGAALYVHHKAAAQQGRNHQTPRRMSMPLWGPEYPDGLAISRQTASRFHVCCYESDANLTADVAGRLGGGQVVAWFQGRMEFGPRALGARSILADPRDPDMRDRINAMVKKREAFRPFAPVVSEEYAAQYFQIEPGDESLYAHMLFVAQVHPAWRDRLPAITHVDGSARLQTVRAADSPLLWQLLDAFQDVSGIPILLNTSLNVRGQPIVRSPQEALEVFESTSLDVLVVGRTVLAKRKGGDGK
jgi:carbamoyltransferase